jgi:hypothetical protein
MSPFTAGGLRTGIQRLSFARFVLGLEKLRL